MTEEPGLTFKTSPAHIRAVAVARSTKNLLLPGVYRDFPNPDRVHLDIRCECSLGANPAEGLADLENAVWRVDLVLFFGEPSMDGGHLILSGPELLHDDALQIAARRLKKLVKVAEMANAISKL